MPIGAMLSILLSLLWWAPPASCWGSLPPSMSARGGSPAKEVLVCTNTHCRKAGSEATLEIAKGLAPDGIDVRSSGCHGGCGSGPNVHTMPADEEYNGVFKAATIAAILELDFGVAVPDGMVQAYGDLASGDDAFREGKFAEAAGLYDQCLGTRALEGRPQALSTVNLKQSRALRRLGDRHTEAEAAARQAIEAYRLNTAAWFHLSDVLADKGDVEAALHVLESLAAEAPERSVGERLEAKAERLRTMLQH